MRNIVSFLLLVITLHSCKIPYNLKDEFKEKASLPEDEAPHIKNSLEWWYFTGHLEDSVKNKKLGVEYVVFHFNPTNIKGGWMVNMAISDPENKAFYYDHQFFQKKKYEFTDLPLSFSWKRNNFFAELQGESGNYNIKGQFKKENTGMNLATKPVKPVVMHDGTGYEDYGGLAKAGYYTFPRLSTKGQVKLNGEEFNVQGNLWYDRQWNCSGVFNKNIAWDWFAIQFEETRSELMVYRLYNLKDGTELFGGTYTDSLNNRVDLESKDIQLIEKEHWRSPQSKAVYPFAWELTVEKLQLKTNIKALFNNQELKLNFKPFIRFFYWEGMCEANGNISGVEVKGNAYTEMTNRFRVK